VTPRSTLFLRGLNNYRDGLRDGMQITLELLLGTPPELAAGQGIPYRGERPRELEAWARRALAQIHADREAER
jgi:hypothetical protein